MWSLLAALGRSVGGLGEQGAVYTGLPNYNIHHHRSQQQGKEAFGSTPSCSLNACCQILPDENNCEFSAGCMAFSAAYMVVRDLSMASQSSTIPASIGKLSLSTPRLACAASPT